MKSFTLPARHMQQCVHHKQQQKIMLIKISSTMAEAEEQFANKLLLLLKPDSNCVHDLVTVWAAQWLHLPERRLNKT